MKNQVLNDAYLQILHHGLQLIVDNLELGKPDLSLAIAQHLHNIPSLLDEENYQRHIYFNSIERSVFIEKIENLCEERERHRIESLLGPHWSTVEEVVAKFAD